MTKQLISRAALETLLNEVVSNTHECHQCRITGVHAIHADAIGCNWQITTVQGSHCLECLEALRETLSDFRGRFQLRSPDDKKLVPLSSYTTR